MRLSHFENVAEYLAHLREQPEEVKQLARDLLISVTSFFRDPDAFSTLETDVIAPLVQAKNADVAVRVWVPGCATGEEAYTMAMLLLEHQTAAQNPSRLQIFATDVDEQALDVARRGIYPEGISADVSPERLARFFTRVHDSAWQVSKQLRETVTFAAQNLLTDPPFSKMDLISCRNVLIYLEPETQKQIIALLHFALKEGGSLFLGPSETVGRQTDLFEPISKKWRIYRRIGPGWAHDVQFPVTQTEPRPAMPQPARSYPGSSQVGGAGPKLLAPTVSSGLRCDQPQLRGPPLRRADRGIPRPARRSAHPESTFSGRKPLGSKLRVVMRRAIRENAPQSVKGVIMRHGARHPPGEHRCGASQPVQTDRGPAACLIPGAAESLPLKRRPKHNARAETPDSGLVRQLEQELEITRDDLQGTIEEMESANEELKASNEEVMSMNEELQSANEELETSKEELQSLNEELSTVNSQLHDKVEEVEAARNDMANLLDATHIPTVFLDAGLRIKLFTPSATRMFNLIATDVGRPIGDLVTRFTDDDLLREAQELSARPDAARKGSPHRGRPLVHSADHALPHPGQPNRRCRGHLR